MVMMVVMMMMMVVPVRSRGNPDINAGTVVVMMVMMTDHNLGGLDFPALCQPLIVGP